LTDNAVSQLENHVPHGKGATGQAQIAADNRSLADNAEPSVRQRTQRHVSSVESPVVSLQMGGTAISLGSVIEEAPQPGHDDTSFVLSDTQADNDLLQMTRCRILPAPAVRTRGALWVIIPSPSTSGIPRREAENALYLSLRSLQISEITDDQVNAVHAMVTQILGHLGIRLLCATIGRARLMAPDANVLFYRPGGSIVPLEVEGVISCPMRPNDIMMLRDRP
jgi:hypothetical protein